MEDGELARTRARHGQRFLVQETHYFASADYWCIEGVYGTGEVPGWMLKGRTVTGSVRNVLNG